MKIMLSMNDLLNVDTQESKDYHALQDQFGVGNGLMMVIAPGLSAEKKEFNNDELCLIRKWISKQAAFNPEVSSTLSTFDLRQSNDSADVLFYPRLLRPKCFTNDRAENENWQEIHKSPWSKIFSTPDHDILYQLSFHQTAEKDGFVSFSPKIVEDLKKDFNDEVGSKLKSFRVFWMGDAAIQSSMLEGMRFVVLLNALVLVFMLLGFRFLFGTWVSGFLYAATLLICSTLVYGAMTLSGVPIDVLTNSLFLMIAVSSIEDFIFVLQEDLHQTHSWRGSFRKLTAPGFFTSLSTVLGFGSLLFAPLEIIRRFGLWALIAAILEWMLVFWFVPALLYRFPRLRRLTHKASAFQPDFLKRLVQWKLPKFSLVIAALIFPLSFLAAHHLRFTDAPLGFFQDNHPLHEASRYLAQTRGWESDLQVIFPTQNSTEELRKKTIRQIRHLNGVVAVDEPTQILDYLKGTLPILRQELIEREFHVSGIEKNYYSEDGLLKINLYLKSTDLNEVNPLIDQIKNLCPNDLCRPAGNLVSYAALTREVPSTLFSSFFSSIILIGLVIFALGLAFNLNLSLLTRIFLSSVWGPAAVLCLIAFFEIRINLVTSLFACVLVGLTGDNAVQFIFASRRRGLDAGIGTRSTASIYCAVLMALTCLIFLFSYFIPPRVLGALLSAGFLIALLGDVWLLKALLVKADEPS